MKMNAAIAMVISSFGILALSLYIAAVGIENRTEDVDINFKRIITHSNTSAKKSKIKKKRKKKKRK